MMEALYQDLFQNAGELNYVTWSKLQSALLEQKSSRSKCACSIQNSVSLMNADLWKEFHRNTNEMIITKAGRRMFPLLQLSLQNLEPTSTYAVLLTFRPVDNYRWKFLNGEWQANESGVGGGASIRGGASCGEDVVYVHPLSPNTGEEWMRESPVGFSRLKLSNRGSDGGKVKLSSLHRYQPVIYLVKLSPDTPLQNHHDEVMLHSQLDITTYQFPEIQFIAVTAYQNDKITQMKIKYNPFAKAFLPGQEKNERHSRSQDELSSTSQHRQHCYKVQSHKEHCLTTPQPQTATALTFDPRQAPDWWSTAATNDYYKTPVQNVESVSGCYYSNVYAPSHYVQYYSQSMNTLP